MNESEMVIPLEGDETGFVPETNDVDEVKGIIIGVQVEEDDRTEARLACEEEDKLRRHDTIESTEELPVGREDNGVKMESSKQYCLCQQSYDPSEFMIGCDYCHDWFHGSCVGVSTEEASSIEM